MSKGKRTRYSGEFKSKVALAALREEGTLSEIATKYGVHPNQVSDWKKQAVVALPGVFGQRVERDAQAVGCRRDRQEATIESEAAWGRCCKPVQREPGWPAHLLVVALDQVSIDKVDRVPD